MILQKGQGAQINPHNKFNAHTTERESSYQNYLQQEGEEDVTKLEAIETFPKTIVNKVPSPDIPMDWSLNPYQGCEHGCAYCYARVTHEFWGYSAGVDFERKILVKKNAAKLLEARLSSKSWEPSPIVLSGNTDCYQPLERKLEITRECLEVFLKYKHPVGIITKNALIQRDLDIIKELQELNLIQVVVSVTTLDDNLRRVMEPRTASVKRRLQTIEKLSKLGVPVTVNMAPIIPGLNSHEVFDLLAQVKNAGAIDANYTMIRLNGPIADVFKDWIQRYFPDRAEKVINQITSVHNGSLGNSLFGKRMRGSGRIAEHIDTTFKLARKNTFGTVPKIKLDTTKFRKYSKGQLELF